MQQKKYIHKNNAGFTLIELLVVIAIIGLLASVVLVSLNAARQKARLATRIADMTELQKALELYFNDNNSYPNTGGGWRSQCALGPWGGTTAGNLSASQVVWDINLNKGLVPTYISAFPSDPSMLAASNLNCFLYQSSASGADYKLLDWHVSDMSATDLQNNATFEDPFRTSYAGSPCTYDGDGNPPSISVYSNGGDCF